MPEPDLESRVAALEARVAELSQEAEAARQDAAAARHLSAANDRDVAEIRNELHAFRQATTSGLNATREDLADLRGEARDGFAEMRGRLDQAAAGQEQIVHLLNTLISREGD
jgi:nitrate reductase assembly molybdenum cofactor insertion protein NarJ